MKYICAVLLGSLLVGGLANTSYARHNNEESGWNVDRHDLDDDTAKTIRIPILFGVAYAAINPDFGDPRGDGTRLHEGQDMFAPKGTPIVSPTEAIVIQTGDGENSGKYIYTANPGGETFRYMHLDSVARLDPGDELKPGAYLGTVGDTGNAPKGVYHLHFEMRDEDNEAQDPYPRLTGEFTLKQKVSFLEQVFRSIRNDDTYATFLVSEFKDELKQALNSGYRLPDPVKETLAKQGVVSQASALEKLTEVIASIPKLITMELQEGSQGPAVVLLQFYLIYATDGPARDALVAAGPTGYFGSVTVAALKEYQGKHLIENRGVYDSKTRTKMIDEHDITINLK